jgi:hypothetical protein
MLALLIILSLSIATRLISKTEITRKEVSEMLESEDWFN